MEKVVYALWRDAATARPDFNTRLRTELSPRLADLAHGVRINIQDDDVLVSESPRMAATHPQIEAVVQLWVDTARDKARAPIDALVAGLAPHYAAWLVSEAAEISNTLHPPTRGLRTEGFAQVVFLGRPPRLTWEAWREIWQRDHTLVGIETQANFEYVQNLVVRPLTYGAPAYVAMIEECFPTEAMFSEAVYFDGVGDLDRQLNNQAIMAESCARFIDFDRIECIPTSQFEIKRLRE